MWSYRVNLDKRLGRDHPLRRINEAVDLNFERGQVAHTYELCQNNPQLGHLKRCVRLRRINAEHSQMGRGLDSASCN